jgi:hypothetical protein
MKEPTMEGKGINECDEFKIDIFKIYIKIKKYIAPKIPIKINLYLKNHLEGIRYPLKDN